MTTKKSGPSGNKPAPKGKSGSSEKLSDKKTAPKGGAKMTSDTKAPEMKPKTVSSAATGAIPVAPRKVRLVVTRLDPWSVMKMAFLLSVAIGVATVVAVSLLWLVLNGMGVFDTVNEVLVGLDTSRTGEKSLVDVISFGKVVSSATIFSVVNVVLLTAIATLSAVIYNVSANLVGGFLVTLADD